MPSPAHRVHVDCLGTIHIVHDSPSVRQPRMLRVCWTPDARQQRAIDSELRLRIDGAAAYHMTIANGGNSSLWKIETRMQHDVMEIMTPWQGDPIWLDAIKPPKTRTPGTWFAWETGEWVKHGNGTCPLFDRIRDDHWHTPAWQPGQDMTPLPPRDLKRYAASLHTGPVEG